MQEVIFDGVKWRKEAVTNFNPDENRLSTPTEEFTYDYLIVATGIELDFD